MSGCRLPEHTPHDCSHRGGCLCTQLWTQCVECQSSGSGNEKAFSTGEGFQCTCASAALHVVMYRGDDGTQEVHT